MAKGGRGGRRFGRGTSANGELVLPNGSKIEFEGELHFDGDDKTITGNVRKNIVDWETKRANMKVEYAFSVDAYGNPIGPEVRGSKESVSIPPSYFNTDGATFTHIHPRGDGLLGGTFSDGDLRIFANNKSTTARAKTKEGTYSISKTNKFDRSGFNAYAKKCDNDFRKEYKKQSNNLASKMRSGKMTYDEYTLATAKAFNTGLVSLHNSLRAGQKQYGYIYTLEKGV